MNLNIILVFLGTLEGFKTRFKELHWSATTIVEHKLADDILSSLIEFQDSFAEESFGMFGKPQLGDLVANSSFSGSILEGLAEIRNSLDEVRGQCTNQFGLLAIIDSYIHDINKFAYLANLD